jgi:hypothetical protein
MRNTNLVNMATVPQSVMLKIGDLIQTPRQEHAGTAVRTALSGRALMRSAPLAMDGGASLSAIPVLEGTRQGCRLA